MLKPKLFTTLRQYDRHQFVADLGAGVVVGIVAIPLAIAFAIASGVSPDRGLITAIAAGLIVSILGGSRVQIAGPTGAFIVVVYAIVARHGLDGLLIATFMAGLILILMGLTRLGGIIKFIPHPVTVGFTTGIAVLIATSQIKDALGLHPGTLPADFIGKIGLLTRHLDQVSPATVGVTLVSLLLLLLSARYVRRIPGALLTLIVISLAVHLLRLPVATIGTLFPDFGHGLPAPVAVPLSFERIRELVPPAFTIALLGAIESLLSAVVADGMIGGRHRSNMELVAQGVANVVSPLLGGIPATGAIARTATNVRSGGRTPVAGIVHALVLAVVLFVAAPLAKHIPMAALAAVLFMTAYHMSEWRSFLMIARSGLGEATVLLLTFTLTVFFDLTLGIQVGLLMATVLFIRNLAGVTHVHQIRREVDERLLDPDDGWYRHHAPRRLSIPRHLEVFDVDGPFFFGIGHKFEETVNRTGDRTRVRLVNLHHVPMIDASGIESLRQLHGRLKAKGVHLVLSGITAQVRKTLDRHRLTETLGRENLFLHFHDALAWARKIPVHGAKVGRGRRRG